MGEALVLQDPRPGLKVVRISNVVGVGQPRSTFVGSLLEAAGLSGEVTIRQAVMAKDYVALQDVVRLLPLIAHGRKLYNRSWKNTTHQMLLLAGAPGRIVRFADQACSPLRFSQHNSSIVSRIEPPGAPSCRLPRALEQSMSLQFEYDDASGVIRQDGRNISG